jgi:hypothetical protein
MSKPSKLFVDDNATNSIEALRAKARRHKRGDNLGFIAIGCLQLLKPDSRPAKCNCKREVAEIVSSIKSLAMELDVPIQSAPADSGNLKFNYFPPADFPFHSLCNLPKTESSCRKIPLK